MRGNSRFVTISLMALMMGFSVGCGKQEPATPQASQAPALPGNWQAAMPGQLAGLARLGGCGLEGRTFGKRRGHPVEHSYAVFYRRRQLRAPWLGCGTKEPFAGRR